MAELVHEERESGAGDRWRISRGFTRSTSATTTTAISSRQRRRRREHQPRAVHDWLRKFCTTTPRAGPPEPSCGPQPQRDPYNYNLDPLLVLGLQALGTHMHQAWPPREPGRDDGVWRVVDGWWKGGFRNTGNFHNIMAILTETIGSPTPMRIPLVAQRPDSQPRPAYPIAPSGVAVQAVVEYRCRSTRRARHTSRATARTAVQHLQDGSALDRARRVAIIGAVTDAHQRAGLGGGRASFEQAQCRAVLTPTLRLGPRSGSRNCATPGRSSFFEPTGISDGREVRQTALREVNVAVHRATAAFQARV